MTEALTLRPATKEDAYALLYWRNDRETRQSCPNPRMVWKEEHMAWMDKVLSDPKRRLYIAQKGGVKVGTVRADVDKEGAIELSWTVAPEHRRQGIGKVMVSSLAGKISGRIRAQIREENVASLKVAEAAGMVRDSSKDGVVHFGRERKGQRNGGSEHLAA